MQIQREEGAFYLTCTQALQERDNEGTTSKGHSHRFTAKNEEHRKVQRRIHKKVGTLLKGGGNNELPSLFNTSPSARDLEEQEAQE